MATDKNLQNLIINKLTKQQYDALDSPSPDELYLVPDEIDDTPTQNSDNPVKSGGVFTALAGKQDTIADLADIRSGSQENVKYTQQTLTDAQKAQARSNIGAGTYDKPSTGIPASDIAEGVIPDVSQFVTKSVNDLANYYLKTETYTKDEVAALIGAIQQFHYEIYASRQEVVSPANNVLYLIGPTGSGADKYEEYVYDSTKQEPWVKIGDTSIDLSGLVTTEALNAALASYVTSASLASTLANYWSKSESVNVDLADVAITGDYNDLLNLPEGSTPSSTTPLMDGTASVGTETAFARGDHRHPSDTSKQDTIADLADIRSGASAGATAYQKPSTGIPKTDLAVEVQTSLDKADTAVQPSDLTPITEVIPSAASSSNQLADKAFVNSSISTATATFRGSFNLVSDLSLTTSATQSQIATALGTAISTADNNDYAFVQIPTSDATPTEIARVERYKYNGSAWAFEYALNNSGFTATQWAALNSGITSGLVSKLSDLPTNSELTNLLAGKQPTIDSLHKLPYSLISDTPAIPAVESLTTAEIDTIWNNAS